MDRRACGVDGRQGRNLLRLLRFSPQNAPQDGVPGHGAAQPRAFPPVFRFSRATPLVRESRAFYNPSNTALESVAAFTRRRGPQPSKRTVVFFLSECLNVDLDFGNSQEH